MISAANDQHTSYRNALNRLGLNVFLALALHGMLILAISFKMPASIKPLHTLDITLAYQPTEQAPDHADFFAQDNQLGSGESDEMIAPSVTEESLLDNEQIQEQAPQPQPIAEPIQEAQPTPSEPEITRPPEPEPAPVPSSPPTPVEIPATVVTQTPAPQQAPAQQPRPAEATPPTTSGPSGSLMARSLEIASIQAQLSAQQQDQSRKPRVRRLTSAPSTMAHDDAIYLDNWRRRIESVGNMNYPEEARRNQINGSLRLLVAIMPDGSVADIEVLQSSGHAVLDNAAIRIVQMAAPFQPFTNEMRRTTDRLEIIRTWKFENRASVY